MQYLDSSIFPTCRNFVTWRKRYNNGKLCVYCNYEEIQLKLNKKTHCRFKTVYSYFWHPSPFRAVLPYRIFPFLRGIYRGYGGFCRIPSYRCVALTTAFLCCVDAGADRDPTTGKRRLDETQTSARAEPSSGPEMSREEERNRRQHATRNVQP